MLSSDFILLLRWYSHYALPCLSVLIVMTILSEQAVFLNERFYQKYKECTMVTKGCASAK